MTISGPITPGGHFTWEEAYRTQQRGLLVPNRDALADDIAAQIALRVLCTTLLEPLRADFGRAVMIHSMYRCPELNAAVGGSPTSQHMRGQAADFHVDGVSLEAVFDWVRRGGLPTWGQVILEGQIPSWVHLSTGTRRQALRWDGARYSAVP